MLVAGTVIPGIAAAMAVDGALITNTVAATYHSLAGQKGNADPYAPEFEMSYLASANVLVSCPMLTVIKDATPTTNCYWPWECGTDPGWYTGPNPHAWGAPGGLVTFRLCTVNTSLMASAYNVVLTDRYDSNVAWNAEVGKWPAAVTFNTSNSADGVSYGAGYPAVGTVGPRYLRWTLPTLAPRSSACVVYTLRVQ